MFTVLAAKERNKTHANVTATTTRRTCALAFAAILPFTALPAVKAAPQTTQTTTAKPSQAQQPRETAGQQNEAAVNAQEFESANEEQQAEKLAKVIEEIDNAPTREDAERIMKENFGEEGMKEAATELGLDPNQPLGQGDPTRAGRSGANNEDFVTCVRDKAFADIKGAFAFNGVLALAGEKNYLEAGKRIVKHLAKQGIRRNAWYMAGLLAWWGAQCAAA